MPRSRSQAALWTAIGAVEEHADLYRRLVRRMEPLGNESSALRLNDRAHDETERVALPRRLIELREQPVERHYRVQRCPTKKPTRPSSRC